MDVFLPYCRLIDRMAYDYTISRKIFGEINRIMGWHDDGMRQFTGFHKHAKAFEAKQKLGSPIYQSYYTFTFVRNPFDFLVSLYFYISQSKIHRDHKKVVDMDFPEFLRWHLSSSPPLQLDFITHPSDGHRLVDYIGRFETLAEDIKMIQKTLGLEVAHSIKHKNPSLKRDSKDYKQYYDKQSRILVSEYFQKDLKMLGYDFDGYSENMPIMKCSDNHRGSKTP